eukprot:746841-Hanusia_phi.AAC.6
MSAQIDMIRSSDEHKRRRELRKKRKKPQDSVEEEEDLSVYQPRVGPDGEIVELVPAGEAEGATKKKVKKCKQEPPPPQSSESQEPREVKESLELKLTPTKKGQASPFAGKVKISEGELLQGSSSDQTLRERLELLTQVSLKDLCRRAGVPVSGKKDELINRLLVPLSNKKSTEKK